MTTTPKTIGTAMGGQTVASFAQYVSPLDRTVTVAISDRRLTFDRRDRDCHRRRFRLSDNSLSTPLS
jgi:hypothetical protein